MVATEFFASQNTAQGFRTYFESIFSEETLDKLYIIKGGPGTGKSHLMKRIAAQWEEDGATVERFLCSSDPDSLDGIYHRERRTAVIDGTSPHSMDCRYPGCVGQLLNTGEFWSEAELKKQREEIRFLSGQKAAAYTAAYAYLRAAGQMAKERKRIYHQELQTDKLMCAARRFLCRELSGRQEKKRTIRLTQSYGKKGFLSLRSLEALSSRRCLVCDDTGLGALFLTYLKEESDLDCICSYSPLFPEEPDGLYFPQKDLCVVCEKKEIWEKEFSQADRYFNMERFFEKSALRSHRQRLRFAAKCKSSLEEGAAEAFQMASSFHKELEGIYSSAMDFKAFDQWEAETVQRLR